MSTSRASIVVGAAVASATIHLLDDNLIEPGWRWASRHVASTLVPLAVAVALAAVAMAPRRRPGTRATAMILLGWWCLMLGAEALVHLLRGSLSGDDWTGLLSAVGGAAATVTGIRHLWRSRRPDGTRWQRIGRRTAKAALGLGVALQFAFPVVDAYVGTNLASDTVPVADLGRAHETVSFTSADGYRLDGWYVPSRNGAAVIVYPGRGRIQEHARMLVEHGYGVLLFDPRGVGTSEGEPTSWGWGSDDDIRGAVAFLARRDDVEEGRVGGLGLSVGGEVLLEAAAEGADVRAVVSEGAGIRSWHEFSAQDGSDHWLLAPLTITRTSATAVFSDRLPPPGLHDLARRIDVPVLFINATADVGGESLTAEYHRLAAGPKELWTIDGGHTAGIDIDPSEYERRVVGFLDAALLT